MVQLASNGEKVDFDTRRDIDIWDKRTRPVSYWCLEPERPINCLDIYHPGTKMSVDRV